MTRNSPPQLLVCHSSHDARLASTLAEEIRCFGWEPYAMALGNLPVSAEWRESVRDLMRRQDAFCFLLSASFETSAPCLAELEEVRRQRPQAPRFLVFINIPTSRCIESEIPSRLREGLGGVARRDVLDLASQIDAVARCLPVPPPPVKMRRNIALRPNPLASLLSQDDLRIRRWDVEARLVGRLRSNRVLSICGLPSSGRSALAIDAIGHLPDYEMDRTHWPFYIVATRECGGSVPDLRRLCSIVFEVLGPPPATSEDDPATALTALLDDCEAWLLLDQFETATTPTGHCKDPGLARFLRIADETLERGRIILTAATPGIVTEGGRRCAHFTLPEWSDRELDLLAEHNARAMDTSPPRGLVAERMRRWASGNPYLLILALREWCATGSLPGLPPRQVGPFQSLSCLMNPTSPERMTILQILSLLATFPASQRLIQRVIDGAQGALPMLNGEATRDIENKLRELVASGLVLAHVGGREAFYQLPGLVAAYLRDASTAQPELWRKVGEAAAASILDEREGDDACFPLVGPAIHDGQTWLWPDLPTGEVSRAVRAVDVLVNVGLTGNAAKMLTRRGDILKHFNRLAPASVRRSFFGRIAAATDLDPLSRHEAARGLALALADAAEFGPAIEVLDGAAEALATVQSGERPRRVGLLEAKNLDLKAYCLRQMGRVVESIDTYEKALGRLGKRGDQNERCKLLRGSANSWVAIRDWVRSASAFDDARGVAERLRPDRCRFDTGRIDCDQAILKTLQGDLEEAEATIRAGLETMRACGDLWNERIALLNLYGIQLARLGDNSRQQEAVQSLVPDLVRLESVVALRAARKIVERLTSDAASENAREWWIFVDLT